MEGRAKARREEEMQQKAEELGIDLSDPGVQKALELLETERKMKVAGCGPEVPLPTWRKWLVSAFDKDKIFNMQNAIYAVLAVGRSDPTVRVPDARESSGQIHLLHSVLSLQIPPIQTYPSKLLLLIPRSDVLLFPLTFVSIVFHFPSPNTSAVPYPTRRLTWHTGSSTYALRPPFGLHATIATVLHFRGVVMG